MKQIIKPLLIALTVMIFSSLASDAKTSKACRAKTFSIEDVYNACVHNHNMNACGLKLINYSKGKYGGTGFYDIKVYGINVKAIKKGRNIKCTATGSHAFYFQLHDNSTPTGLSLTHYYFGFNNKADCDKFCSLLRRDGLDIYTPSLSNGWYEIEINENDILCL